MRSIKFMIAGGLLILLGPVMSLVDIMFSGFMAVCWFVGIPLFLIGLFMPADWVPGSGQSDDLPQKECPRCGKTYDFDHHVCPYCGYDYKVKSTP